MAGYRILDIETVPDLEVWTPPAPRWVLHPHGELTPALGEHSEELVARAGVRLDDPFPPPHACRIVAMSWVDLSDEDDEWYFFLGRTSICEWSHKEADLCEARLLAQFQALQRKDHAMLVTWNGRSFDLPVINMRSLKHKIHMDWYYQDPDVRHRYKEVGHLDLMDWFGDYGGGRSNAKLGDIARLIKLPGKTGEVTGSGVGELHAKGDHASNMELVRRYCGSDTLQTAILFVRSRYHRGMLTAVEHDKAVRTFAVPLAELGVPVETLLIGGP